VGCKTLTQPIKTLADRKRLQALEIWIWRRMEKISWVDKISNKEVLQRVNETKTTLDTVRKCKRVWLEHVLRHDSLLHDIIERRMRRKTTRGSKRTHLLSDPMKGKYVALKRMAEDSKEWHKLTGAVSHNLLLSRLLEEEEEWH